MPDCKTGRKEPVKQMEERVNKVLGSVFTAHNGGFDDDMGPAEIPEWDSMNHLNLIMALGTEFGIEIGFEEMLEIQNIGDIKKVLGKHGVS